MLPTTEIERGRPITPSEFDAGRPVAILGWDAADRLFGTIDPIDKTITLAGVHFRVVGVRREEGRDLRSVAGRVRGRFRSPRSSGSSARASRCSSPSCRRDPSVVKAAMDDATRGACGLQRRLRPKEPDNFGVLSSDTFLEHLQPGDVRRSSPC